MQDKRTKSQLWIVSAALVLILAKTGQSQQNSQATPKAQLTPISTIEDWEDWVTSIEFSPDGKLLAAGSYDAIAIFKSSDASLVFNIKTDSGFAKCISFSPGGKTLAVGGYQTIQLIDTESNKIKKSFKGHRGQVTGIAFTADGKTLISGCDDQTVRVWNVENGKLNATFDQFKYPVQSIALSEDDKMIGVVTGDPDRPTRKGFVHLLNLKGDSVQTLEGHEKAATDVLFVKGGKRLLSASRDKTLNVYEIESGKAHGFYGGHVRAVNAVIARNGYAISVSGGGIKGKNELHIWKIQDGEEILKIEPHQQKVTDVAISPDGKMIATASEDKTVNLWNAPAILAAANSEKKTEEATKNAGLRVGIIGLDTSHVVAFTGMLNAEKPEETMAGYKVVAAYPKGSADIESSASRIPKYTKDVQSKGVAIVDSIDDLLKQVDCVLLETNDGRPHLEQLIPCLKAGKPVFIDKPIAASLADAIAIFEAAKHFEVPVFSSSSLRFSKGAQAIRAGKHGKVLGADAYSPYSLEATHPDLFWYGIHGVETLFTVMGPGCKSVSRSTNSTHEIVVGQWDAGSGTFRGIQSGKRGYGGTVFTEKGIHSIGSYDGYKPLLVEIVKFFKTRKPPVDAAETLEIYAFMEAADESKRQGGKSVTLKSVMEKASQKAKDRLKKMGIGE